MLEVGSACSSAPEGAMLPFAPAEEPWEEDMEVFGGSATSGEVSVVAHGDWSHPPVPFGPWPGLQKEGAWAHTGERGAQASPLEAAGRWNKHCPKCAFSHSRQGLHS